MPTTGVNPKLFSAYNFADHVWTVNGRADLLELAERCVKVNGVYYAKLPAPSTAWVEHDTIADAKKHGQNFWMHGHLRNGSQITAELIKTFFDGIEESHQIINGKAVKTITVVGACPMLQGRMVIPYGPQFVSYKHETFLNIAQPSVLAGDAEYVALGQVVLMMIYRSLCDGVELDPNPKVESELLLDKWLPIAIRKWNSVSS